MFLTYKKTRFYRINCKRVDLKHGKCLLIPLNGKQNFDAETNKQHEMRFSTEQRRD